MIKEPGTYEMEFWEGQLQLNGEFIEWLPNKIHFNHEIDDTKIENYCYYKVIGNIWDIEFNTGFKCFKIFDSIEHANSFFEKIIKKYPNSNLTIKVDTSTTVRTFH